MNHLLYFKNANTISKNIKMPIETLDSDDPEHTYGLFLYPYWQRHIAL
jgi:hypothetical protein